MKNDLTTTREKGTLMHSLLTDNSLWTFWKEDWTKMLRVQWGGKTPFREVKSKARKKLGLKEGEMIYERSISSDNIGLIID